MQGKYLLEKRIRRKIAVSQGIEFGFPLVLEEVDKVIFSSFFEVQDLCYVSPEGLHYTFNINL